MSLQSRKETLWWILETGRGSDARVLHGAGVKVVHADNVKLVQMVLQACRWGNVMPFRCRCHLTIGSTRDIHVGNLATAQCFSDNEDSQQRLLTLPVTTK